MLLAHWDLGLLEFRDQVREPCTEISCPQSKYMALSVGVSTWMCPSLSKYLTLVPKLAIPHLTTLSEKSIFSLLLSFILRQVRRQLQILGRLCPALDV